ncbi:hypothetical protein [Algoriphagus confluentis]|uniref:YARHG domain-containing protein n=1 Tax=Algoriphagus confluentis TaxID=1697556 RepID=A0ABQ6PNK7_9BACT|nr:hypothetical protein Aconfl_13910 [Algoriphagus confluentis]
MQGIFRISEAYAFILVFSVVFSSFGRQKDILFQEEKPLELELTTQFKSLKGSESDTVYFPTFLKYKNEFGITDSVPVDLRARGNSRRKQCYFMPLWLKIPKGVSKNTPFQGNRSLKLVLPCQEGPDYGELITKEFLVYQLYQIVSPIHFRTRRVNLTLTDQQNKKKRTYALVAFVIEDVDEVAKKHDAKKINSGIIFPHLINDTLAMKQDFFSYMIGNTDWSNTTQHNVRMLDLKQEEKHVPVPYDFDYAGFVNAPYALPYDYLPIKSVTERLYRGVCRNPELTQWVKNDFLAKEDRFFLTLEKFKTDLSEQEFQKAKAYLLEFFEILKNEEAFQSQMIGTCQEYIVGESA